MEGKADMLLANRTLSALIVVCLLISGFAGFLFLADAPPAKAQSGDLTVSGTYTIQDIVQPVDGNVVINSGGNLIIRDATLTVMSNQNPTDRHTITVSAGGTLTLDHGIVTTYQDQIDPWPFLTLNVNGGTVSASAGSVLQFPGNIILTANAQVTLDDTTVTALTAYSIPTGMVADQVDDGPAITMTDSTLKLFDSSIDALPEYKLAATYASNITLNGNSHLLGVNSYISIDFGPAKITADWYAHNVLDLKGFSRAYLYGCWFADPGSLAPADMAPAIVTYATSIGPSVPVTKGAADNTGDNIGDLAAIDAVTYDVAVGQTMEIDTWNIGALSDAQPVGHAVLSMTYTASPTYTGTVAVQYAAQGSPYQATTIVPVPPGATSTYNLPMASILTAGDIRNMNLRFSPVGGSGSVQIDQARITFEVGSDAFIYRWLNATVGDEYGVPIAGATVTAKFTGSTSLEGRDAFYYTTTGVSASPPAEVLNYMGKTAGNYRTTDSDGTAIIPYITDMIVNGMSSSEFYVGSYAFTGSAVIGGGPHSSTSSYSFIAYPAMLQGDKTADYTVKILGVSAESPNSARWLVVPPNLTIEDMTYYHAGDVIVAAGGTLWIKNSAFQLVQSYPNQRSIIVDGTLASPAKLKLDKSVLVSDKPIDLIVQGNGVLMANDTVLQGVNVVAKENAQVIFHNVTMDGALTTSYDSNALLSIYDSDLALPVTLSGSAVGGFTNTSVPSVVAEDDAIAYIYRWIHVTVYDGAGYPLPGATVTTRFFVNGTTAASGVSDSTGVARVSSTGTIITATGSTFVGNYRVNTSLSHLGNWYYGDEFSVGVMPYTEPLGRNATFATVTIPDALPDLVLLPGAISFYPNSPMNHASTYINLTVSNIGPTPAHNVYADFYDSTDTGTSYVGRGQVDMVPADGTAVITFMWQAHEPLAPKDHNITALADPTNIVPELDESPEWTYGVVVVQNLPDLEVRSEESEIWAVPSTVVVDNQVQLRANVHNVGDATVLGVYVEFLDDSVLIASTYTGSISKDGLGVVSVAWTPNSIGSHTISVRVNNGSAGPHNPVEISYSNNLATKIFSVLSPPNLVVSNVEFVPVDRVPGGDMLIVRATVTNTELAPVTLAPMALYRDAPTGTPLMTQNLAATLVQSSTVVEFAYLTESVLGTVDVTFYVVANPAHTTPVELTYDDNEASATITILDMRPDVTITTSKIFFKSPRTGEDATNLTYGKSVRVIATVENLGGRPADNITITVGARSAEFSSNMTFSASLTAKYFIGAETLNHSYNVTIDWPIRVTNWGWYEIWVYVDSDNQIDEQNEANNFAVGLLEINPLDVYIVINPDKFEYNAGDLITLSAVVYYTGTFDPVPEVTQVVFLLQDSNHAEVPDTRTSPPINGTVDGVVSQKLQIPTDLGSGSYELVAEILGESVPSQSPTTVTVTKLGGGGLFPMWIWYLIIIIVVGAVAGFTVYTYKYGLGKYVECGECGAFIPAASKRCPKCGVEFEAGTMKCSECGAWIPAESTECPNCGVKFVGELEEEGDYLERMRAEYDEMVSKYRELAKPELGKKFSDRAFDEWWRKQPGYITFDDWLAKEEEKKKEGPVPCPVCGTLNPKEATVCHKCGTVFGAARAGAPPESKGPPPAPPSAGMQPAETTEAAAPRMVIRRPIEKKVVPKKIIRTASGQVIEEEPKEGENNQ